MPRGLGGSQRYDEVRGVSVKARRESSLEALQFAAQCGIHAAAALYVASSLAARHGHAAHAIAGMQDKSDDLRLKGVVLRACWAEVGVALVSFQDPSGFLLHLLRK